MVKFTRFKNASIYFASVSFVFSLFFLFAFQRSLAVEFQNRAPELERFRDGIPHFLDKVARGEKTTVAYFGGSITAADGWRVQTLERFREIYAPAEFIEVNAAIGGTGSNLGVFRLERDVLRFNPDLVFVEFTVNDSGEAPEAIWRQIEGIVRQIWRHDASTDIVFVYTFCVGRENDYLAKTSPRAVAASEMVADFYGIPSLDFNIPVVKMAEEGKLVYKADQETSGKILFSNDGVHPLKEGHLIYTKVVLDAFEKMKNANRAKPYPDVATREKKLESTFVSDNCENAKMVPLTERNLIGEWKSLPEDSPLNWTRARLGDVVYTSDAPGAKATIKFKGSYLAIYDILGPDGGQVYITVDGVKSEKPVPRFDSFCTYWRLATLWIAYGLDPEKEHVAEIEIDEKEPSREPVAKQFDDPEKILNDPKYKGRNVWFGPIMVIGDVLE